MADELHIDEAGQRSAADVLAIAFERWPWAEDGVEVASDHCRSVWLPVIGPAAWLLWCTVTQCLTTAPLVEWSVPEIARSHGIGCAEVVSALERLARYELAVRLAPARWRMRRRCPPADDDATRHREVAPSVTGGAGRRPQLWAHRKRPIASRGAR